jgi:hypothetical protein
MAPVAPVAPVRSTFRHVLLTPERYETVSALAGSHVDDGLIAEHERFSWAAPADPDGQEAP